MKTQGEIESAISDGMSRFEQEYMGRGPKEIRAYLIDDLVVIRLKGVLTAAEQHLVMVPPLPEGQRAARAGTESFDRDSTADYGGHGI
jgi:uncharacterized protein YbcI